MSQHFYKDVFFLHVCVELSVQHEKGFEEVMCGNASEHINTVARWQRVGGSVPVALMIAQTPLSSAESKRLKK